MATGDEPVHPLPPREGPSPADEPPAVALPEPPALLARPRGLGIRAGELPALLDLLGVLRVS